MTDNKELTQKEAHPRILEIWEKWCEETLPEDTGPDRYDAHDFCECLDKEHPELVSFRYSGFSHAKIKQWLGFPADD